MMSFLILLVACFLVGVLTLLTGFGLGTLLPPFFTFFFDVKLALFLVALVHLSNNLFKLFLFRRHVDAAIFRRFGLVSLLGAVAGASLFGVLPTGWLKKTLGAFLVWTGGSEFLPGAGGGRIARRWDLLGGLASGFLGGILGTQGAIRSAYLLNYSLSKEAFIATGTAISILIDLTRIPFYLYTQRALFATVPTFFILAVIAAALAGTRLGTHLLQGVSLGFFRQIVGAALLLMGIYFFF